MEWKPEVVQVPVTDVYQAKTFYDEQVGLVVDFDSQISDDVRLIQLTPPGSACSIALGAGTDAPPGSVQDPQLIVSNVESARAEPVERGAEAGPVRHMDDGVWVEGRGGDWNSFVFYSDPDGNG